MPNELLLTDEEHKDLNTNLQAMEQLTKQIEGLIAQRNNYLRTTNWIWTAARFRVMLQEPEMSIPEPLIDPANGNFCVNIKEKTASWD